MKVKDILCEAAAIMGRQDLEEYLKENNAPDVLSAQKDCELLLRCYNLAENEIALEYRPISISEEVETQDGLIFIKDLKETALDIISIVDEYQNKIGYKIYPEYIKTAPKKLRITYTYIPQRKKIDDESAFSATNITQRIAAMGTACEFLLISGLYDEALMWDKRYKDSLLKVSREKTAGRVMPAARRWY